MEWRLVGKSLVVIHPGWLALALGVFLLGHVVRAWRWSLLFLGRSPGVRRLFLVGNAGMGLNSIAPVRVLGEVAQFALLTLRDRVDGGLALASLGTERVLDIVVATCLLALGLLLVPRLELLSSYVGGVAVVALVSIVLVLFVAHFGNRLPFIRRVSLLAAVSRSLALLERAPLRTTGAGSGTLLYWLMIGLTAWLVSRGLDLGLTYPEATLVVLASLIFATVLPGAPAALGTFEAPVVYMLSFLGVEKEAALAYALLLHLILFVPPMVLAAIVLPREGFGSLARLRELRNRGQIPRQEGRERVPPPPSSRV